jgi:hypothetical protein
LSNTRSRVITYRLGCPVVFHHRATEWAAQAESGAIRYDITFDSSRRRWYLDASWQLPQTRSPALETLRSGSALGLDLNANHLDCWVLDHCGNPIGLPCTVPLNTAGLPATARDGRVRTAITSVISLATTHACHTVIIESLDFADARQTGRETLGRGRRGKRFRHTISGIPTRRFRDRLVGMTATANLWVVTVDPGWTSAWGRRYWHGALNKSSRRAISEHHAAAVVIGRRGLGLGARRRLDLPRLRQNQKTQSHRPR